MIDTEFSVAAHFGAPFPEQRNLQSGSAVVDLSHHGIITVSGPDRLEWLNSMFSQELGSISPGVSTESLLLDPQGHIQFAMRIVDDGESTWIMVDPLQSQALAAYLDRMRFTKRVEVTEKSEQDRLFTVGFFTGAEASDALSSLRESGQVRAVWLDPWSAVSVGGWQYAAVTADEHPASTWNYAEAILTAEGVQLLVNMIQAGTLRSAGTLALQALRVMAWRPAQHTEVDDRALPHEFDWLRSAVHLNKGCYRGQETVAKVHNLGHPPRRLALLHLDGSDAQLPEPTDLVFAPGEEKPIGRVTIAARHFEWGAVALALLKRSVPVDAQLEVQHAGIRIPATQEVIVPPEAGATRVTPRIAPLR